ncbi:MAG: hypothetical protein IH822_04220 [Chloroflexi bacterium]|nr:hypothetical protein [Chloroflexota bacterium]
MALEHEVLIQEVIKLAAEGAPPEQVVERANQAKAAIVKHGEQIQRAVNILDGIVPFIAPGTYWEMGWKVTPKVTVPYGGTTRETDRPARVRDIANSMLTDGAAVVRTDEIAERLFSEGDTTSSKHDLATAAGNVLTRSGKWRRIDPGVYKPIPVEPEV